MVNTTRAVQRLQTTPPVILDEQIRSGARDADLRALFGPQLAAEMRVMTEQIAATLGGERPLVVLLPGIMGSTLFNSGFSPGLIWLNILGAIGGRLDLLELTDGGQSAVSRVRIEPRDLIATTYLPLRLHLEYMGGCDVVSFAFDWRFTPLQNAELLRDALRSARADTGRKVHLVGHSMGGLVARAYCLLHPEEAADTVQQVITLGTPYLGAAEAIRTLAEGGETVRLVQRLTGSRSIYRVVRSLPGLYALLPAPRECWQGGLPLDIGFDWLDASAYQVSEIRQAHADATRREYTQLAGKPLPVPVTAIYGRGVSTCYGATKRPDRRAEFAFDFGIRSDEGDGTVPVASAQGLPGATFIPVEGGKHGDLPLYGDVRRAVQSLVHGDTAALPGTLEPGLLGAEATATLSADMVPQAPTPGTEKPATTRTRATRLREGRATPEDIAALTRATV